MSPTIRDGIPPLNNAKDFLETISLKFKESEKAEMGLRIKKLTDMRYEGDGCVRTYILDMMDFGMKLRNLGAYIDDNMLIYLALNSLPNDLK